MYASSIRPPIQNAPPPARAGHCHVFGRHGRLPFNPPVPVPDEPAMAALVGSERMAAARASLPGTGKAVAIDAARQHPPARNTVKIYGS